ncbi:exosome complex component RRP45 [Periplaneta americana]|uniref:Exosome complex component RRP45 n=1 Tax=Periplaneta americana TaxID=6978 RepID=A0ABQ8U2V4_PERAM|nr:hypothetical protein ANN_03541 [Periplaneta americana]
MKETILSNCEKSFVLRAITEGKRLDGRNLNDSRELKIYFGTDWGCCQVSLGETKVLAQVLCEVQQPKPTRPNEGLLFLNVELSPMGAPHFETGRQSELGVQLNRLLEKCIKDSRCVDLESLCIVAEEKVWALRVNINVLNHEGNLVDAASVAALTALCHFRRPDVTITGEETVIHDPSERDPIPISLHHHPVCVSYALFNKGDSIVVDPTAIEERVAEAQLVFGMNAYRELCGLHLGGNALTNYSIIVQCAQRAAVRAAEVVALVKSALEEDEKARTAEKPVGFAESTRDGSIMSLSHERLCLQLHSFRQRKEAWMVVDRNERTVLSEDGLDVPIKEDSSAGAESEEDEPSLVDLGDGSAELIPKQENIKVEGTKSKVQKRDENQWLKTEGEAMKTDRVEESDEDMSSSSDIEVVKEISFEERMKCVDSIELSGDSEEEETVTLEASDIYMDKENKKSKETTRKSEKKERGWYPMQQW